MGTEQRSGEGYGYDGKEHADMGTETRFDCPAGLMFCYNMPEFREVDDCAEAAAAAAAWAADQSSTDALMRYYNE